MILAHFIGTFIDCQFSKELVKIQYQVCTERAVLSLALLGVTEATVTLNLGRDDRCCENTVIVFQSLSIVT